MTELFEKCIGCLELKEEVKSLRIQVQDMKKILDQNDTCLGSPLIISTSTLCESTTSWFEIAEDAFACSLCHHDINEPCTHERHPCIRDEPVVPWPHYSSTSCSTFGSTNWCTITHRFRAHQKFQQNNKKLNTQRRALNFFIMFHYFLQRRWNWSARWISSGTVQSLNVLKIIVQARFTDDSP